MNSAALITIDGSYGEGGGQVLRTALTLSMVTGIPFEIKKIRANRSKPGLLRQHLTAVNAATQISQAQTKGAELGAQSLSFRPGTIRGGDYRFAIGTAGSCMLVLQTILPALWFADGTSTVEVSGGTHNRAAPPADFLINTWCPVMSRMGVQQTVQLKRHGFFPAGGGQMHARVTPIPDALQSLELTERGQHCSTLAEVRIAGLAENIAHREREQVLADLPSIESIVTRLPSNLGPGNVVIVTVQQENLDLVFCGFGDKKIKAESVASNAVRQAKTYLASHAAADEYLADQLLLPMALAGSGSFTSNMLSSHFHTNVEIIRKFLPVEISFSEHAYGWLVEISS